MLENILLVVSVILIALVLLQSNKAEMLRKEDQNYL